LKKNYLSTSCLAQNVEINSGYIMKNFNLTNIIDQQADSTAHPAVVELLSNDIIIDTLTSPSYFTV